MHSYLWIPDTRLCKSFFKTGRRRMAIKNLTLAVPDINDIPMCLNTFCRYVRHNWVNRCRFHFDIVQIVSWRIFAVISAHNTSSIHHAETRQAKIHDNNFNALQYGRPLRRRVDIIYRPRCIPRTMHVDVTWHPIELPRSSPSISHFLYSRRIVWHLKGCLRSYNIYTLFALLL